MRPRDLTRWNRAGLKRFRYVDGNALTYLERLRQALAKAYNPGETGTPRWSDLVTRLPVASDETREEKQQRLIAQYEDTRRDFGWETLRSFARSTHVLAEHIDAYANETFIGPATQWDSLRKLVAMLDARPAPPASARTDLAFEAKEAGKLAAGFQAKNAPDDGSAPAIFETLEDLDVDPALNAIRPTDWNRSQVDYVHAYSAGTHSSDFPLAVEEVPPVVGEIGVLVVQPADSSGLETAFGIRVDGVSDAIASLAGQGLATGDDLTVKRWRVSLLAGAEQIITPRLAGPDVVILTPDHNLVAGRSSITWDSSGWKTAEVLAVDGDRVRLNGTDYPGANVPVYLLARSDAQIIDGQSRAVLPIERGAGGKVWSLGPGFADKSSLVQAKKDTDDSNVEFTVYHYVPDIGATLYLPADSDPVGKVIEAAPSGLVLPGAVDDIIPGDWIVSASVPLQAVRIDSVEERDGDTAIGTNSEIADLGAPIHAVFARQILPLDHDRNMESVFVDRFDQITRLIVTPDQWSDLLKSGRKVIVADEASAHAAVFKAVDAAGGTIDIAPPIPGTESTEPQDVAPMLRHNTTIYANVVAADHGETKPLKIIGSGDAIQSGQRFELQAQELSFVTDPLMPAGVRAAIEIYVGERQWMQVANLRDSGQTDAHFEARITEDGPVEIRFGDGRNGRRLPTGTNNVRAVWRKGVGEAGNFAAGSLVKIVKPSPLIEAVRQPIATAGGADTESVASLRENAAAGLLTLDRAVSSRDFANLAAQNSSVLQAHAYVKRNEGARGETVAVVVVPAGGRIGVLKDELETFLANHTVPGVTAMVEAYMPLPLSLDVTLRIRSAEYDPENVADAVEAAIIAAFDLKATRLSAPLFRSQILHLIEAVEGVENIAAEILTAAYADVIPAPRIARSRSGGVRSVRPAPNQMIHYDAEHSTITIRTEEFNS